eukprot:UN23591
MFISIAMADSSNDLIQLFHWCGFLAMLGYTWIQYIAIYLLKQDRLIENVLSWSSVILISLIVWEIVVCSENFEKTEPWGYSDIKKWEEGLYWKIALIITYLDPPLQFMWGYSQAIALEQSAGDDEDEERDPSINSDYR